jgi:hypothetical protein
MNDGADVRGNANPSDDVPDKGAEPDNSPRDAGTDQTAISNDATHVVYDPLPTSRSDDVRQQKALRRVVRDRQVPPWVKKIPWLISWKYMLMRRHDPNYEEHYEKWEEQERRNYNEGDSQ